MSYEIYHVTKDGSKCSFSFGGQGISDISNMLKKEVSFQNEDAQLCVDICDDMGYLCIDDTFSKDLQNVIRALAKIEANYLTKNLIRGSHTYGNYIGVKNLKESLQSKEKGLGP